LFNYDELLLKEIEEVLSNKECEVLYSKPLFIGDDNLLKNLKN